ncbi:MAG: FISUMP domain-containing protein [Bacteroidota bacterium]
MKKLFAAVILLGSLLSCEKNHAPVIKSITCSPENRNAGTLFSLSVRAYDDDYDRLYYSWEANGGEFLDEASSVQTRWQSPLDGTGKSYTITVTVSDGHDESWLDTSLLLTDVLYGSMLGGVHYKDCLVMIPDVTITVGGQTTISDDLGQFSFEKIPVGTHVLNAVREGFATATVNVSITRDNSTTVNVPMISALSTGVIHGYVNDQDNHPVSGAIVVMLNPDGQESGLTAITDATGFYEILRIPYGKRIIRVWKRENEESRFVTCQQQITLSEQTLALNMTMTKLALNGVFIDVRDNRVYLTRLFGNYTWMAENLDYLPEVFPGADGSGDTPRYYVYNYEGTDTAAAKATGSYRDYGVLYNYEAALTACPVGWHLPETWEWNQLAAYIGEDPGKQMKTNGGWANNGNGTNQSGFSALPAGSRSSAAGFSGLGETAKFWTPTEQSNNIMIKTLYADNDYLLTAPGTLSSGYSVRCIRD